MSAERSRSRSPTDKVSKPLYRDGRGNASRMMRRAPPMKGILGQQMSVRGRVPANYRRVAPTYSKDRLPDNDDKPWNSRSMAGRRDEVYADDDYYDPEDCDSEFLQSNCDGYQGFDGYSEAKDNVEEYPSRRVDSQHRKEGPESQTVRSEPRRGGFEPRRGGFEPRREGFLEQRRGEFEQRREGFEQRRGGFEQRRGGFEQRRGGFEQRREGFEQRREGFEQRRGGFEQRRGGFEQRRGGFEPRREMDSRPHRQMDYDPSVEHPRQGGFQSRGRFDTSYPDENDGENREKRFEARPGDWTCVQCMFSNFATRTSCYKCQKEKGQEAPETLSLKKWECTECFASNHERRFDCFKCQKAKPKNAKECEELTDWDCPSCRSNNSARRTNCGRCDAARPGREKELEANPDWKCGGCGIMNWSWRDSCYKCHANKADGKIPEGAPQDWECKDCGKSNWARRTQCFGCRAPKGD